MQAPEPSSTPRKQEILRQALKRKTPAERAAFLDEACGGDTALRAETEALLSIYQEAERAGLNAEHGNLPSKEGTTEVTPTLLDETPLTEGPGTVIGPYKLLEKIGEGGFGAVYVAEQKEPVKRRVALKLIKLGMDTRQVVARFEAERQALALMDHPNIAKVLDAGSTESGRPYFVMELVRGIKLTDYCDQNKLSTRQRIELFIKVCEAIQHAHQKGIIHRDIKPSNILVTLHDGAPVPKVIDFGIAKATQQDLTDKTLYTQLQQFIGTPAYMSPEQAEMSGLDIDTRSDIYSLGVLLYELLTGRTPIDAKELMLLGIDAMRKTIREKEPVRPSTKLATLEGEELTTTASRQAIEAPRLINLLRGDLDWVVMKCLEKDRTRRYETANGLAADLRRHLNDEPVVARPPSTAYRFHKAFRRNKIAFASTAAVACALVGGVIASTWEAIRAAKAEREQYRLRLEAETARSLAQTEARRAETGEQTAKEIALALRRRSYAADMKAAQVAIEQNSRGQAAHLLENYLPQSGEEDERGVEWRYLWRLVHGDELATWTLGDGLVGWVRCTSDGREVISATLGRKLRVHDSQTGQVLRELDTTWEDLEEVPSLSDDGRFLSYLTDGVLSVYQRPDWKLVARMVVPEAKNESCGTALSSDGQLLAIKLPATIRVFSTKTWSPQFADIFVGEPSGGRIRFTHDGTRLFLDSSYFRIYDVATGQDVRHGRPYPRMGLWTMAVDGNDRFLAETEGGSVTLRRFDDLETIWVHTNVHSAKIQKCVFSKDGQLLATAAYDQTIALLRVSNGTLLGRLRGHLNEVWDVNCSADGNYLFSSSKDGTIKKWRWLDSPDLKRSLGSNEVAIPSFGPANRLLTMDPDKEVLSTWSGLQPTSWPVPPALLPVLTRRESAYHDGNAGQLVAFSTDGNLTVFGTKDGAIQQQFPFRIQNRGAWSISRNLRWLAVVLGREQTRTEEARFPIQTVQLWDLTTKQMVKGFSAVSGWGYTFSSQLAFSPDGRFLAFPNQEHDIVLWNLAEQSEVHRMKGPVWHLDAVRFSDDSKLVAAGGWDGVVYLWDVQTGRLAVPPMQGHGSGVFGIDFSLDGQTLLTAGSDNTVRFWSIAAGLEMLRLNNTYFTWPLWQQDSLLLRQDVTKNPYLETGTYFTIEQIPALAEIEAAEAKAHLSKHP